MHDERLDADRDAAPPGAPHDPRHPDDDILAGFSLPKPRHEPEPEPEPLPQLSRMPRAQWVDALRPLSAIRRMHAVDLLAREGGFEAADAAQVAIGALSLEQPRRARPVPVPRLPAARVRPQDRRHQVNLKLTDREHEALATAAEIVALRPGQLARLLVMRGVHELCREYGAPADRVL